MEIDVKKLMAHFMPIKIGGLYTFCNGIDIQEKDFFSYVKGNVDCYFAPTNFNNYSDFHFNLKIRSENCVSITFSPYATSYKNCHYKCDYCIMKVSDFFSEIYTFIKDHGKFPNITFNKDGKPVLDKEKRIVKEEKNKEDDIYSSFGGTSYYDINLSKNFHYYKTSK